MSVNGRSVPVTLDRQRRLRYTFNALCALQGALGKSLDDLLSGGRIGFLELRGLLWAGLLEDDPKLGVEQAGALIQGYIESTGVFLPLFETALEALKISGLVGPTTEGAAASAAPFPSETSSSSPSGSPSETSG